MKKSVFFFLLWITANVYSQTKEFTISGKIDGYRSHLPIKNAKIELVFSDSATAKIDADSLGYYSFKKEISRNTGCVIKCYVPLADPIGVCSFSYKNSLQYFHQRISFTIYIDSLKTDIVKDFYLGEMNIDYIVAKSIYFQKNSTSYSDEFIEYYSGDTAIDCAIDFLHVHPKYNLTIYGYCDKKEKNKEQLVTDRAQLIYNKFIERGVDPSCISYKGFPKSPDPPDFEYDNVKICNSKVELQFGLK